MELREPIEEINRRLVEEYGRYNDKAKYRVVFSEDEYEKRWTNYTDDGMELLHPEVRLLPKYKQWAKAKYILEVLFEIPEKAETDLVERVVYEPLWIFQDKNGNYLPPFFDGCSHIIEARHVATGKKNTFTKYKDKNISPEEHLANLKRVENELFGNETDVGDALHYGSGVSLANTTIH